MFEQARSRRSAQRNCALRRRRVVDGSAGDSRLAAIRARPSASTPCHGKCPISDATSETPSALQPLLAAARAASRRNRTSSAATPLALTRPSSRPWKVHVASADQIFKPGTQRIDIGIETIGCKAGADGTLDTKSAKQRLRAVVAAAQGHSMAVEVTANLLCREAFDREGYDPAAIAVVSRPCTSTPLIAARPSSRRRVNRSSWVSTARQSSACMKSTAAPRPTAAAIGGVPASKRRGGERKLVLVRVTWLIIWPPVMNGGMAASKFAPAP